MAPRGPAGVVQQPGPGAGHGVEGNGRQVGELGEERPVRDVLAERNPVDLLVAGRPARRRARRPPPRCGMPWPRRVSVTPTTSVESQADGQVGRARPPRVSRRAARRARPRPRATAPGRGGCPAVRWVSGVGGGHRGGQHHGRVDLGLAEAAHPAALDGGCGHRPDRGPAVGGVGSDHAESRPGDEGHGRRWRRVCPWPADGPAVPDGPPVGRVPLARSIRRSAGPTVVAHARTADGRAERAEADPAEVDGGGQRQGAAQPGHTQEGPVGLAEEDATDGEARRTARSGGPPRPGSSPPGRPGPGPLPDPGDRQAGHADEQRLQGDEHDAPRPG